jgi:hypothetical protein
MILKRKLCSGRDKVPPSIAKEGRKSGVVQKDQNGDWRIISYKQNPPEFWDAHYDTKSDAKKALRGYQASKSFSEKVDKGKDNLNKAALYGGGAYLGKKGYRKFFKYLDKNRTKEKSTENSEKVFKKLLENTEGTNIIVDNKTHGAYLGSQGGVKRRSKLISKLKSEGLSDEEIKEYFLKNPKRSVSGTDTIKMTEKSLKRMNTDDLATLAHELGHSKYGGYADLKKTDKGGKLGRLTHELSDKLGNSKCLRKLPGISAATGVVSGYRGAKQKDETGKESILNKVAPYSVSLASTPLLSSEAAASIKGLKLLKKYGADKATMSKARNSLLLNGSTYLTGALVPIATAKVGREVGKLAYKVNKED